MSSSSSWPLQAQKLLIAVSLAAAVVLLCTLARRRLGAYEEVQRARERLVYRLLANVSVGLDRIEEGLDELATRAAMAKAKLSHFAEARKQSLVAWSVFRDRALRDIESNRRRIAKGSSSTRGRNN